MAFTYKAVVENEFAEHLYPAEAELILKEGAQVMFLKNDLVQKDISMERSGGCNHWKKKKITVDCDGALIEVLKETWENSRYTLNRSDGNWSRKHWAHSLNIRYGSHGRSRYTKARASLSKSNDRCGKGIQQRTSVCSR